MHPDHCKFFTAYHPPSRLTDGSIPLRRLEEEEIAHVLSEMQDPLIRPERKIDLLRSIGLEGQSPDFIRGDRDESSQSPSPVLVTPTTPVLPSLSVENKQQA